MYTNVVASSAMLQLYLRHDFYNTIFKIKLKLCITSGSALPKRKILGAHLIVDDMKVMKGGSINVSAKYLAQKLREKTPT
jgi:hypothetical protein